MRLVVSALSISVLTQAAFGGVVGTVEANRIGYGLTRPITATGSQFGGVFTFPIGQFIYNFRNGVGEGTFLSGNLVTFCTDLTQDTLPGYFPYNVVPLSTAPLPGPSMGTVKAQAIADVWTAAAGQQFTNQDYAAAMQMLVWDIMYDYTGTQASLSVTAGTVQFNSPQAFFVTDVNIFNTLKASIGSNSPIGNLRGLTNPDQQDQLVLVPSAGPLSLLGVGLMCGISRRRR